MIIFGWRSLTSIHPMGTFHCPVCKSLQMRGDSRTRTWFTLFFVPLVPVGSVKTTVVCGGCSSVINPLHTQATSVPATPTLPPDGVPPVLQHATLGSPQPALAHSAMATPNNLPGVSTWAIVSLIAGLLSPLFIIVCFLSLITSIVAVATGHVAIYSIRRGAGRLKGLGLAIAGVCLGYLSLTLTIAAIVFLVTRSASLTDGTSPSVSASALPMTPEGRLREAELSVMSYSSGKVGLGNTPTAEAIATGVGVALKKLDEQLFTSNRERVIELTRGEFLTYCELHPKSCVLIVHVPAYRDYNEEAREALAELAWATAVSETSTALEPGDQLAVALRGTLRYGDIMLGTIPGGTGASGSAGTASGWREGKSKDLIAFFKEPPATEAESTPAPTSTTAKPSAPNAPSSSLLAGQAEATEANTELSSDIASPFETNEALADAPAVRPPRVSRERRVPDTTRRSEPAAPAAPKFENRIPIELALEIAADGWNVTSMSFMNRNQWLAVGRLDSTISVFDTVEGKKLFQSERLDALGQVVATAESNDQKLLIAGGSNGATATFSLSESGSLGSPTAMYRHAQEAKCIVASPRHPFMISGGRDGTLAWHPYNHRPDSVRLLQKLSKQVKSAFLPEQGVEALATDGYQLLRFSLRDGSVISSQELGKEYPHAAAFHPAGAEVAISYGSRIDEFDTLTGALRRSYSLSGFEMQWTVALHPMQPWLFSGAQGVVIVWDRLSGEQLAKLDLGTPLYVQTLAMSDDGAYLATVPAAAGQAIKIFKLIQ